MLRNKGFTLIELMIVVSIIATITSIAVPSLLQSRMAANEVATIAALRSIATAQSTFKRSDWNFPGNKVGVLEYARPYYYLANYYPSFTDPDKTLVLADAALAKAHLYHPNGAAPRNGYFFLDIQGDQLGRRYDRAVRWGVFAAPQAYGMTGRNCYLIQTEGVVYQKDQGNSNFWVTMHSQPATWGWMPVE